MTVVVSFHYATGQQKEEDGKPLLCDKRDKSITCVFCRYLHLILLCSVLLQKDLLTLEEDEVWQKMFPNIIIVMPVRQGLPSHCESSPLPYDHMPNGVTKFECSPLLQVVSLFALDSVLGTLVKENDALFLVLYNFMSVTENEDLLTIMHEIIIEKLNSFYYHQLAVLQRRLRTVNHTTQKTSMERK